MIVKAALIATAALILSTGCEKTETPASAPTAVAEKAATPAPKPAACSDCTLVTPDNFNRAETDMYFAEDEKMGGFGKLQNHREVMPRALCRCS